MPENPFTLYWTTSPPTQLQTCKNGWTRTSTSPSISRSASWLNQVETWFGAITRQAIRRGTFASVTVLIKRIKDYIAHWNDDAKPFEWTATADEILAKVKIVQANVKKLVDNNSK